MIFDLRDRSDPRWAGDRLGDEWPAEEWPADDWAADDWAADDWPVDESPAADDWSEDWPSDESAADDWWTEADGARDAVQGFRLVLADDYAGASDDEVGEALDRVLGAMSPGESFSFGRALSQVARAAGQVVSDPMVANIARTALPIAGGALGTVIGGPIGTALGGQLGSLAAGALPGGRPPAPRPGTPPAPAGAALAPPGAANMPATAPATALPAAAVAGRPDAGLLASAGAAPAAGPPASAGSAAAAQGLVLAANPLIQQALAAAALGSHGQTQVAGLPVARLLGLLSQVVGQAAAEADARRYGAGDGEAWDELDGWSDADAQELYTSLVDATSFGLPDALDDVLDDAFEGGEYLP